MKPVVASLALLALSGTAHAAACDALAAKATSATGEQAVAAYAELAKCDRKVAERHFPEFMRATSDVGTLVALSLAAIDAQVHAPVWNMLDKVPDFSARDEVAKGVGAHCADHPGVVPFLKGAYSGVGDRQFNSWREAFGTCEDPALVEWLGQTTAAPPSVPYDEKYNAVTEAFVDAKHVDALPVLEKAAVAAGTSGGPFSTLLDRMADAVRPEGIGAKLSSEAQVQLEAALGRVAASVPPEQVRLVADRLYQIGAEEQAAGLLPKIYPDRVQSGGELLYGVASVESCGGKAVVHFATVTDPAKRWSIVDDVSAPARAFKARLKCTPDAEWPVLTTPEPVASDADVATWAQALVADWAAKDLDVKARQEKGFALK